MDQLIQFITGILPILIFFGIISRVVSAIRKAQKDGRASSSPPSRGEWTPQPAVARGGSAAPVSRPAPAYRTVPALTGSQQIRSGPQPVTARLTGSLEGASPESGLMENSLLDRGTLEGAQVEGLDLAGRSPGTPELLAVSRAARRKRLPVFSPARDNLLQGVIYAEILGRPGGRRARR